METQSGGRKKKLTTPDNENETRNFFFFTTCLEKSKSEISQEEGNPGGPCRRYLFMGFFEDPIKLSIVFIHQKFIIKNY